MGIRLSEAEQAEFLARGHTAVKSVYASQAVIRLDQTEPAISWDNSRIRLKNR